MHSLIEWLMRKVMSPSARHDLVRALGAFDAAATRGDERGAGLRTA